MQAFSSWILGIAGITLLGVLIDIVLPNGQMQKYCRSIFGLILLFVVVAPIPKLLSLDVDFSNSWDINSPQDSNYLQEVYKQQLVVLEQATAAHAKEHGFDVDISIVVDEYTANMRILSVKVDTKNKISHARFAELAVIVADFLVVPLSYVQVY